MDSDSLTMSNKLKAGKSVYLLASCGTFQDKMMLKLIKKYEGRRIACTKYFYSIYLKLKKSSNKYLLDFVEISFLENSKLAASSIAKILVRLNRDSGVGSGGGSTQFGLYEPHFSSLLSIVQMYSRDSGTPPYNYLFVPVIVDYSMDVGLVHQCALVVDLQSGIFLFYEPYGIYTKYSAEYSSAIEQFLSLYNFPKKYYSAAGTLNYSTWHKYFEIPVGIQTILLRAHNSKKNQYDVDKETFFAHIKQTSLAIYNNLVEKLKSSKDLPVHKDDLTYDTLNIMSYCNKDDIPEWIKNEATILYYKYNSKTCVTITITELDYFFDKLAGHPKEYQKIELQKYYTGFEANLNAELFKRINEVG